MAWLEKDTRTGLYKVAVRLSDGKLKRSLRTTNRREAESVRGTVENTLTAIERGWLNVPEGVDVGDFLISGGKAGAPPTVSRQIGLAELFADYFASLPDGALEASTVSGMRTHERHLCRFFGKRCAVQKLTTADLQRYVDHRSKQKGIRGRLLTPNTIKKALVTLRTVWNWGTKHRGLVGRFPHAGVRYAKLTEKPHFQTVAEIERQIQLGHLTPAQQTDLWDSAFLTLPEIAELLEHVRQRATLPFLYPLFAMAAHTGARRSELLRTLVTDVDFATATVCIHERKRKHVMRTTRRVPLSPFLAGVLKAWLAEHPGGQYLFCLAGDVPHSHKRGLGIRAVNSNEAHGFFKRTLADSKWDRLRGWHLFRHSFCSNCAAAGVDQRVINAWVGHQTEDMVRRYRHLIPNQQQEAIERVFGG